MIQFNLKCRRDHVFEAWFRDGAAYQAQSEAGEVSCPVCGSKGVSKALMTPHVAKGARQRKVVLETEKSGQIRRALTELRRQIEDNCDYVGAEFAEEARKIHYAETDVRNIYGETSDAEAEALHEEGVKVQRVPWLPRNDS